MKRINTTTFYAIIITVISIVIFASSQFADTEKSSNKSILSTSITFVTDQPERFNMLNRLEVISKDISLLGEHACAGVGFRQMSSRLSSYDVMNRDHLDLATGESILCDYELLETTSVVESLQTHVNRGKRVILYGEDIDLELFCTLFNLTDSLPSEHDKKELADSMVDDPSPSSQLVAVGVESADWGNTLITVHDISYDPIRAIDLSIANAIHAKVVK